MTLQEILASILNPNAGQQNQLSMAGAPAQVGDHANPALLQQAQQGLAPQMPQQATQHAFVPPQAPQGQPMPQSAPQAAPEANGGGFGGGIGGFLSNLLQPQAAQRNHTIGWLQKQGLDQGTATLLAGSKPALQQYLLSRSQGKKPIEVNGRLIDPDTYQVLADFSDPKAKYNFITGRDGSIFRADETEGSLSQVYGGKPDQPTDVQEYEYAKGQGYQGSFQQFQIEQKRAGASQVNIDQKAEGAFDKKLAENQATIFTEMATEGMNAKADIAVLGELEGLLGQTGGTLSGISGALAKYGIGGAGMSDTQAAQALINKLVPTQRQPGSGTMSDRDVELFTRSLPSLWNAPGGNAKILGVMRGLAQYKQQQGAIATAVMNGEMTRQDAAKALQSLPNPLAEFKASQPDAAKPKTLPQVGEDRYGYRFKGGDPSEPSNWEKAN